MNITRKFTAATLAIFIAIGIAGSAMAATEYFRYSASTNIWNTTSGFWGTSSGGPYSSTWVNNNDAVFEGAGGTLSIAAGGVTAGNISFSVDGYTISSGNLTLTNSPSTITVPSSCNGTINAVIAGTGAMTKSGNGTLTLGGGNLITGDISVNAGTLYISAGTTRAPTNYTVAAGAALRLGVVSAIYWSTTTKWDISGTLTNEAAGQQIIPGTVILTNGSLVATKFGNTSSGTFQFGNNSTMMANGVNNLIQTPSTSNGTNTSVIIGSSLTEVFNTPLAADVLTLDADISGPSSSVLRKGGAGTLILTRVEPYFLCTTVLSNGTMRLSNSNALQNSTVTMYGGVVQFDSNVTCNAFTFGGLAGNSNIGLTNNAGTPITFIVGTNNASTTYSGTMSGSAPLVKTGTGTLSLTGNNGLFPGDIIVNGGTLSISQVMRAGTNYTIATGAALNVGVALGINWSATTKWTVSGAITNDTTGQQIIPPTLILTNGSMIATKYGVAGNGTFYFNLNTLTTANGANNLIQTPPNGSNTSLVVVNGAYTQTLNTPLAGDVLTINGEISGGTAAGLVKKIGAGAVVLTRTNTYLCATMVSNGTLVVNGTIDGGSVTVAGGATLRGTGRVASVTNSAQGFITAADTNTTGTLTVTNLVMAENSNYIWNYGAGATDTIVVNGNLTLPAVATVTVSQVSGTLPNPGVLFSGFANTGTIRTDLRGWVINGALPSTRAKVMGNQVVLTSGTGSVIYVQ